MKGIVQDISESKKAEEKIQILANVGRQFVFDWSYII
jgi:hypothetical protein